MLAKVLPRYLRRLGMNQLIQSPGLFRRPGLGRRIVLALGSWGFGAGLLVDEDRAVFGTLRFDGRRTGGGLAFGSFGHSG